MILASVVYDYLCPQTLIKLPCSDDLLDLNYGWCFWASLTFGKWCYDSFIDVFVWCLFVMLLWDVRLMISLCDVAVCCCWVMCVVVVRCCCVMLVKWFRYVMLLWDVVVWCWCMIVGDVVVRYCCEMLLCDVVVRCCCVMLLWDSGWCCCEILLGDRGASDHAIYAIYLKWHSINDMIPYMYRFVRSLK